MGRVQPVATRWASPSALVKAKDGEPDMSEGGYSLDDGLNRPDKTHECWLRVGERQCDIDVEKGG